MLSLFVMLHFNRKVLICIYFGSSNIIITLFSQPNNKRMQLIMQMIICEKLRNILGKLQTVNYNMIQ